MSDTAIKIDKIDKQILQILQENGKITNSQLAKEIGLSPAPTLERVKKLESSGIIKNYHAELNTEILGLDVGVFLQTSLKETSKESIATFLEKINKIPEVVECHHVTGSADFLMKVLTKDIKTYNEFILNQFLEINEIGNVQSMVILNTLKNSKSLPVETNN